MAPSRQKAHNPSTDVSRRSFILAALAGSIGGMPTVSRGESHSSAELNLTAASWPTNRYDGENTGTATDIEISNQPTTTWSRAIDDPRKRSDEPRLSAPIRTQRLVLYTTDEAIVARGSADGSLIWRQNHPESCHPQTVPVVANGTVITANQQVTGWNLTTGKKLWETELPAQSVTAPLKTDGTTVYVCSFRGLNGLVNAIDVNTGEKAWSVQMDGGMQRGVAIGNEAVYAVNEGGLFRKIRDGEVTAEFDFNGGYSPTLASSSFQTPIAGDSGILIPQMYRLSNDGNNENGGIFVLNKENGGLNKYHTHSTDIDSSAAVYDGEYIVANSNGDITSARVTDGVENWSLTLDVTISTPPSVVDETVILGTNTGEVIGLAVDTGQQRWRYRVLTDPISGVIAGENSVFVTGQYNHIGGIHLEEAVEAKSEVQELIRLSTVAGQHGISFGEGEKQLRTASRELYRENYTAAFEAASAGVDGEISEVESVQETIESTQREAVALDRETPYNATEIFQKLTEAKTALQQKDMELARRKANQSATRVTEVQAQFENATAEIDRLIESIRQAQEKDIPIENASVRLNQSRTALFSGDFEQSISVANTTTTELAERTQNIERYRRKQQEAENLLAEVESQDVTLSAEREMLKEATNQFEAGQYEVAADKTNDTIESITTQRRLIESYREAQTTLEQHQKEAENENIQLIESQTLQNTAHDKFEAEEYASANQQMNLAAETAESTIETAKTARNGINTAEKFDPIQPFVNTLANQFGSQKHLLAAKGAYQSGKYERALSHGKQARNAQQAARLAVNGGIAVTGATAYGIYRYDGIDRAAEYLSANDELKDITD